MSPWDDASPGLASHTADTGARHRWHANDTHSRRLRWSGSVRVSRAAWIEPKGLQQRTSVQPRVQPLEKAHQALEPTGKKATEDVLRQEREEQDPVHFSRVETEREAIERRRISHELAKALVARFSEDGAQTSETPAEIAAAKIAEVARLHARLAAVQSEKEALEHELESVAKQLCEETSRADKAEAELRHMRDNSEVVSQQSAGIASTSAEGANSLPAGVAASPPVEDVDDSLPVTPALARQHVEAIRGERLRGFQSSPALRDMFIGCIELLAADIYADSQAHFVLELLQNADDNEFSEDPSVVPTACFAMSKGAEEGESSSPCPPYLVVANNEKGLSRQDLLGLCAISKSSKVGKKDRTGKKGIGFKSVFAVSACPHVLSGPYTFKFDVREDRMGYITPTWVGADEMQSLPAEVREMHQQGLTCIYLPLSPAMARSGVLGEVQSQLEALDPATLLFLRRLRRVELRNFLHGSTLIEYPVGPRPSSGLARESVSVTNYNTSPDAAEPQQTTHEFFVSRARSPQGLALDVALPVSREGNKAVTLQGAFAALPLCQTGLAVALNADWDVSASRDGVHENKQNEQLALEAARVFAKAVQQLQLPALDYLGDRPPLHRFWRRTRELFFQELLAADVPCLPVEDEGEATLAAPTKALRRPPTDASTPEKDAASLVDGALLLAATGCHFAREPTPTGLRIQVFGLEQYLHCFPHLLEAALAHEDMERRGGLLAKLYSILNDFLQEPVLFSSTTAGPTERLASLRTAKVFPVKLLVQAASPGSDGGSQREGVSTAVASLQHGPIFAATDLDLASSTVQAFLPSNQQDVSAPGKLRIISQEVQDSLPPSCAQLLGLRPSAGSEHLLGLATELHLSEDVLDEKPCPDSAKHVWASLEVIREATQRGQVPDASDEDPLVEQGRMMVSSPERLAKSLVMPAADGSLRHIGTLRCSWVLGVPLDLSREEFVEPAEMLAAATPPFSATSAVHERSYLQEMANLKWEHFLVRSLGMQSAVCLLPDEAFAEESHMICHRLSNCDWWISVLDESDFVQWFIREHAGILSSLRSSSSWKLSDYFSADFDIFFRPTELLLDAWPPPIMPWTTAELPLLARGCLLALGLALYVDDEVLIKKCAPLLLRADDTAEAAEAVAQVYGALSDHLDSNLLEHLRHNICVPGRNSCLRAEEDCIFLPEALEGLAELTKKVDLRIAFPGLRELFVDRVGVADHLSAESCIAGLEALQARVDTSASGQGKLQMATAAYRQLQLVEGGSALLSAKSLLFIPATAGEAGGRSQWRHGRGCMWYDVPGGCNMHSCASLEAHYPADLKTFFLELEGVAEIDAEEVMSRLSEMAVHDNACSMLAAAYGTMDRVRKDPNLRSDEPLRRALGASVEVPGRGKEPADGCLFLPAEAAELGRHFGLLDLGAHFAPELQSFFSDFLGVRANLSAEELLALLKRLRADSISMPSGLEAPVLLRLAAASYQLLMLAAGDQPEKKEQIAAAFCEEPLLFVPSTSSATAPEESDWHYASSCVWFDAPSGVRANCSSLEFYYSPEILPFFKGVLGVASLDASEISSRLDALAGLLRGDLQSAQGGFDTAHNRLLTSVYDVFSRLHAAGVLDTEAEALAVLREKLLVVQPLQQQDAGEGLQVVTAEDCLALSEGGQGIEAGILGKIDLGALFPGCKAFFTSALQVPGVLRATDCLKALQALTDKVDQLEGDERQQMLASAHTLYRMLEEVPMDGRPVSDRLLERIIISGKGAVDRRTCMYMDEGCEGLADLLGKVDLRLVYPDCRRCFVDYLKVPMLPTVDECLAALRSTRDRSSFTLSEGSQEEVAKVHRLALAVYSQLSEVASLMPQAVDLSIIFSQEELLVLRYDANQSSELAWCKSGDCMWHDAPALPKVRSASLERCYPEHLRDFLIEGLGVRALDAGEVSARLDALLKEESKHQAVQRFAFAYAEIQDARQTRLTEGMQFWDPSLLKMLRQRVYAPQASLSTFQPHSSCTWQSSWLSTAQGAERVASKESIAGRHNLLEAYEAALGTSGKVAMLRKLKEYFVDYLQVPDSLSVDECLDGLRALQKDRASASASAAAFRRDASKMLYMELARSLLSSYSLTSQEEPSDKGRKKPPSSESGAKAELASVAKAFKKESLIFVPGAENSSVANGEAGLFCTTDQCIWSCPEEAPEDWDLTRHELAPFYGDEMKLKTLFTELLGVPMSVRFTPGGGEEKTSRLQEPATGQPLWLLSSSEGKELRPWKRPHSLKDVAKDISENVPEEARQPPESDEGSADEETPAQIPRHLERGYASVDNEDDGDGYQSKARKAKKQEQDVPPSKQDGKRENAGSKFTIPEGTSPPASSDPVDSLGDVSEAPPPPEPHEQVRGIAADGRQERKRLLMKLSRSVNAAGNCQLNSQASRIKHRPEESVDCNPQHDIERWASLELKDDSLVVSDVSAAASIPIWIEREGRVAADRRLHTAHGSGELEKFAMLLKSLADLFNIPCHDRINIFEEDSQAVAFNGGALYFNLRYFVEEGHAESWEDAVCFWTISFAHELAHFESLIHDRLHGRTMEHAQRAVLPGLPRVLNRPWGCEPNAAAARRWSLRERS